MSRPHAVPIEDQQRIVLSVLTGEMTASETARHNKASEQSIHRWKARFLQGGHAGLVDGGNPSQGSAVERELAEWNEHLKIALGEAAVKIRVWQKLAEHRLGPPRPRGNQDRVRHVHHEVPHDTGHLPHLLSGAAPQGAVMATLRTLLRGLRCQSHEDRWNAKLMSDSDSR